MDATFLCIAKLLSIKECMQVLKKPLLEDNGCHSRY